MGKGAGKRGMIHVLSVRLTNATAAVRNLREVGSSNRCLSSSAFARSLRFLYQSRGLVIVGRLNFFDVNLCLKDCNVDRLKIYLVKAFLRFVIRRGR